jgi:glycosyltransferase involved in cell wall biosynthesis
MYCNMDSNPRSGSPRKKKVGLFLASKPHHGGTFQHNLAMLEAVAALRPETYESVIVYQHLDFLPFVKDYETAPIHLPPAFWDRAVSKLMRLSRLPVTWQRAATPYLLGVAKSLMKQQCDLWIFASQESLAYEIPVPALMVIHDLMHRYQRGFPEVSANGEYERRERHYQAVCRWARGIMVESELGKKQVVDCYGRNPENIFVLPTVTRQYILDSQDQGEFSSRYVLPGKYFFYPAQFWEHKNHKRLIQAAALLKDSCPDIQLVFVGSQKNAYLSVRALVDKLGMAEQVHFLGYVPESDMAGFYRRARALVMPTFFGPTNIPPREAIALGCPVAVSDIDGMPDQMGDAALFFNPSSVSEMAQVMERLWRDDALCQDLARRGLVKAAQWTQSHFNARLQEIIDALLFRP